MPESFEWLQRRHFELLQLERSSGERQSDYVLSQANDLVSKLGEAGTELVVFIQPFFQPVQSLGYQFILSAS